MMTGTKTATTMIHTLALEPFGEGGGFFVGSGPERNMISPKVCVVFIYLSLTDEITGRQHRRQTAHEQSTVCSKTTFSSTAHEQTIVRRQLMAGDAMVLRPNKTSEKCFEW